MARKKKESAKIGPIDAFDLVYFDDIPDDLRETLIPKTLSGARAGSLLSHIVSVLRDSDKPRTLPEIRIAMYRSKGIVTSAAAVRQTIYKEMRRPQSLLKKGSFGLYDLKNRD